MANGSKPTIYDCFIFFNELDLLDIRLNLLGDVVDKFVLVEATETHQGEPKPLYFADNYDRFRGFGDRIIHVVVEDLSDASLEPAIREHYQRNCILNGLREAGRGDVIMVSDVDEIPRPEVVRNAAALHNPTICRQVQFYYFLNCVARRANCRPGNQKRGATVIFRYESNISEPQRYRDLIDMPGWRGDAVSKRFRSFVRQLRRKGTPEGARFVEDAGWHFSYLGGADAVVQKLEAFSHDEYNTPEWKEKGRVENALMNGWDLFGRPITFEFLGLDDGCLPNWVRDNAETRYPHLLGPPTR